jgi:hypothetical protein
MADANPLAKYSNLTSLKGKVVMITGASSGIGEACAWRFAAEGAFACMPHWSMQQAHGECVGSSIHHII